MRAELALSRPCRSEPARTTAPADENQREQAARCQRDLLEQRGIDPVGLLEQRADDRQVDRAVHRGGGAGHQRRADQQTRQPPRMAPGRCCARQCVVLSIWGTSVLCRCRAVTIRLGVHCRNPRSARRSSSECRRLARRAWCSPLALLLRGAYRQMPAKVPSMQPTSFWQSQWNDSVPIRAMRGRRCTKAMADRRCWRRCGCWTCRGCCPGRWPAGIWPIWAQVLKVEPPLPGRPGPPGDDAAYMGPGEDASRTSTASSTTAKRRAGARPEAARAARSLARAGARGAWAVVEGFRPGVMERLRAGPRGAAGDQSGHRA